MYVCYRNSFLPVYLFIDFCVRNNIALPAFLILLRQYEDQKGKSKVNNMNVSRDRQMKDKKL